MRVCGNKPYSRSRQIFILPGAQHSSQSFVNPFAFFVITSPQTFSSRPQYRAISCIFKPVLRPTTSPKTSRRYLPQSAPNLIKLFRPLANPYRTSFSFHLTMSSICCRNLLSDRKATSWKRYSSVRRAPHAKPVPLSKDRRLLSGTERRTGKHTKKDAHRCLHRYRVLKAAANVSRVELFWQRQAMICRGTFAELIYFSAPS